MSDWPDWVGADLALRFLRLRHRRARRRVQRTEVQLRLAQTRAVLAREELWTSGARLHAREAGLT